MLLPNVSLPKSFDRSASSDGEIMKFVNHVGVLGPILLSIPDDFVWDETSVELLGAITSDSTCYLEGFKPDDDELVSKMLDQGRLHIAFFNVASYDFTLLAELFKSFPRSRVGASSKHAMSPSLLNDIVSQLREFASHFYFKLPQTTSTETIRGILEAAKTAVNDAQFPIKIYFELSIDMGEGDAIKVATFSDGVSAAFTAKVESDKLKALKNPYANAATSGKEIDIVSTFVSCIRSDRPDGLFTTVVCDDHGVCLGLVYSNAQSIRYAVFEKRGTYYSRSRKSLWKKGESSNMTQELLSIRVDCDGDALRFSVVQNGDPPAFCHLMTRTCWGGVHGIQKLEAILLDRKKAAPVGSYTKRLFDDPDLLRKKLLEEVQELIEAIEPDHIAAEAADVLYFAMTRCVAAGVGLREIERHLDQRTLKIARRPGDAKAWRTANAEQILAAASSEKADEVSAASVSRA